MSNQNKANLTKKHSPYPINKQVIYITQQTNISSHINYIHSNLNPSYKITKYSSIAIQLSLDSLSIFPISLSLIFFQSTENHSSTVIQLSLDSSYSLIQSSLSLSFEPHTEAHSQFSICKFHEALSTFPILRIIITQPLSPPHHSYRLKLRRRRESSTKKNCGFYLILWMFHLYLQA